MANRLEKKICLITGGASGIGHATAIAFAREGGTVLIADRDRESGERVVAELKETGAEAHFFEVDVAETASVKALFAAIASQFGRLDCAVNNAGVEGPQARIVDVPEELFDLIMAINVKGVWLCLQEELSMMFAQKSGAIVNMSSVAGLVGAHKMSAYCASKHAVIGLTKTAATEYGKKGIRVNAVCPSVIETPMVTRVFEGVEGMKEVMESQHPFRRLGRPEEVAEAVTWLCSNESSYVNGTSLTVDGGFTAE